MAKVCKSKILNHKLYESNHWAMIIKNTYNDSQKGLRASISFMDSKRLEKIKIEYKDILVFSNFVETSKTTLNLLMYLFDYPSLPTFWVTSSFWITLTKGPQKTSIENTTSELLVNFLKNCAPVHKFSKKLAHNLQSVPATPLEELCAFYI